MEFTPESSSPALIFAALKKHAHSMSGWLKFLGVINIIMGIPSLIVLVGALHIWLGVLLYQAGTAAGQGDEHALLRMMGKLKTYFIVNAVLALFGIAVIVLFILFAGVAALLPFAESGSGIQV